MPAWTLVFVEGLDSSVTTINFHDDIIPDVDDRLNRLLGKERTGKNKYEPRPGGVRLSVLRRAQRGDEISPPSARLDLAAEGTIRLPLLVRMPA